MDEFEDYYCNVCTGCGEEGCCSHLACFSELVKKNTDCKFGESYIKEAEYFREIAILGEEIINKLENGLYDSKIAVETYRKQWNIIFDKIYNMTKK